MRGDDASAARVPPYSIEAEQAVLGGLLSPAAWDQVADKLAEDDFYRRDHRLLFRAIAHLSEQMPRQPCDAVTLGEWLDVQGVADQTGGAGYVIELASTTPSAANIVAYAEIVREKSLLRQLIDAGTLIATDGFDPQGKTSSELLEAAEQRLFGIAELGTKARSGFTPTPALSPSELRSRARRLAREHGLALIVIDYLQLMQMPGSKENRATEVAAISRALKALAKDLNAPVVALSQLNRSLEQRADKRPVMSDLRESGGIEQDADIVMFIFRPWYYDNTWPHPGEAELIVAKQRNGPTGTVRLLFEGQFTCLRNMAPPT